MTQTRPPVPASRASVFDAETQCPNAEVPAQWEDPTGSGAPIPTPRGGQSPITRSPSDCWHSEGYLIGWLVKTHGWRVVEPGLLVKGNLSKEGDK